MSRFSWVGVALLSPLSLFAACGDDDGTTDANPSGTGGTIAGSSSSSSTTSSAGGGGSTSTGSMGGDPMTGGGGAAMTGGAGGVGGDGGDGGVGGVGGSAPPPLNYPRLILATTSGVKIWDDADTIASDAAADHAFGNFSGATLGLATAQDRLAVAVADASSVLALYDGLATLSSASMPAASIPASAAGGITPFTVYSMRTDSANNLWLAWSPNTGSVRLFPNLPAMTSASTSQAQYVHMFQQIFGGAVYDPVGQKLLAGQVSGAGVVAWNNPLSDSGEGNASDWQLHAMPVTEMELAADSLYVMSQSAGTISIWRNLSAITSTTAPQAVMTASGGLTRPRDASFRGDTMVISNDHSPTDHRVLLYFGASTITGAVAPSVTVTDAALVSPRRSILGANGLLYVMIPNSVLIFENATTTPTLKAQLTTDTTGVVDMLLLE